MVDLKYQMYWLEFQLLSISNDRRIQGVKTRPDLRIFTKVVEVGHRLQVLRSRLTVRHLFSQPWSTMRAATKVTGLCDALQGGALDDVTGELSLLFVCMLYALRCPHLVDINGGGLHRGRA